MLCPYKTTSGVFPLMNQRYNIAAALECFGTEESQQAGIIYMYKKWCFYHLGIRFWSNMIKKLKQYNV